MREALWIRKMMDDFGMDGGSVELRADSKGAISLVQGWKFNAASKHIVLAYHLKRDYIAKNLRASFIASSCRFDLRRRDRILALLGVPIYWHLKLVDTVARHGGGSLLDINLATLRSHEG
eukprot:IDg19323t1